MVLTEPCRVQMFSTPEGIRDFIYGNISDKYKDDYTERTVYKDDKARLQQDRIDLADYKSKKAFVHYNFFRIVV